MHPVSTLIFLLGYGLALPIGSRFAKVRSEQNSLALVGHQTGVGLALIGWTLRGSFLLAGFHLFWLVGAKIWFRSGRS